MIAQQIEINDNKHIKICNDRPDTDQSAQNALIKCFNEMWVTWEGSYDEYMRIFL